jgi:hypothetical protein
MSFSRGSVVQDDRRAVLKVGVPVGFVLPWELPWWLTADRDRIAPGTARRAAQSFARSVRHKMIDAYRRPLRGVTRVEDAGASWYATLSCGSRGAPLEVQGPSDRIVPVPLR